MALQSGWQYYLSMPEEGLSNIIRHRNFENSYTNSKSEALNPKQIRITKIQNTKQDNLIFEHLNLEFRYCSPREIEVI